MCGHAGDFLNDGAEHIAGTGVIQEAGAGFVYDRQFQEGLFPAGTGGGSFEGKDRIFRLADRHAEQVPYFQCGQIIADRGRPVVGKE